MCNFKWKYSCFQENIKLPWLYDFIFVHFVNCCHENSAWEEIHLAHTIIVTTKGHKRKQPGFFKLPNEVFCISTKKCQAKLVKTFLSPEVYWTHDEAVKEMRCSCDIFQVMHSIPEIKKQWLQKVLEKVCLFITLQA